MAEWLGNMLSSIPEWLFIPFLILIVVVSIFLWWVYETATVGSDFSRRKKVEHI
jgi:uncharacterized membrane protein YqiK